MTVSGFMYMCDRRNRFGFCFYDFLNYILEFLLQLGLVFFSFFYLSVYDQNGGLKVVYDMTKII